MNVGLYVGFGILSVLALWFILYPLKIPKKFYFFIIGLFAIFVAFFYGGYGGLSQWKKYSQEEKNHLLALQIFKKLDSRAKLIAVLKQHLHREPESFRGWYLLGKLYAAHRDWLLARDAFSHAYSLNSEDVAVAVNYAESLWRLNHHLMTSESSHIIDLILEKNPMQLDALSLLALDAYYKKDYQHAIYYWKMVLQSIPAQSKEALMIRKAIAKIDKKIAVAASSK